MKTFVLGDIHGAYKALMQCLERSHFDYAKDSLIVLGDVCDGWPEVNRAIDELLKIKNLEYIIGNHDLWTLDWALYGIQEDVWTSQGGANTLASYNYDQNRIPLPHIGLLQNAHWYFESGKKLFVHAGIDFTKPMHEQTKNTLVWDRSMVNLAHMKYNLGETDFQFGPFEEIFVGHTPTVIFNAAVPQKFCNVWMMDTGAGWSGKLTIMDVETKESWQSDPVVELYPYYKSRN